MALTKISTGMLKQDAASSDLNIDAGTLYLDVSNNRVGVANTSPSYTLDLDSSSSTVARFQRDSSVNGSLTIGFPSQRTTLTSSNSFIFVNNGSERMRIDSSGNVLIGTTTESTWTNTAGHVIRPNSSYTATRDGAQPLIVNRLTSDGTIIDIRNDGSTDGQINTYAGRIAIGSGSTGIMFDSIRDVIAPHTMSGNDYSTTIDLGRSAIPFQNLYLSGTANAGAAAISSSVAADYVASFENTNSTNGYGVLAKTAHTGTSAYAFGAYGGSNPLMVVRGDGNVGIGTTSPGYKLEVNGTSSLGGGGNDAHKIGRLTVDYLSNGNPVLSSDGTQINFSDEIALRGVGIRKISTTPSNLNITQDRTGYDIVFNTSPTTNAVNEEVIRFTHDKRVGIGTSSPSVPLHVDGSVKIDAASGDSFEIYRSAASNFKVALGTANAEISSVASINIKPSGTTIQKYQLTADDFILNGPDLSIGTTSPRNSAKLTVAEGKINAGTASAVSGSVTIENYYGNGVLSAWGATYSSGGAAMLYGVYPSTTAQTEFTSSTGIALNRGAYVIDDVHRFYAGSNQTVAVGSNVTMSEVMRIESDGKVGIGTQSPASKLSVQGDGTVFRMDGTANTSRTMLFRNVGTGEGIVQTDGNMHFLQEDANRYMRFSTANIERMHIDSRGIIGVGVTPSTGWSGYNAIQIGPRGSINANSNSAIAFFGLANNGYYDGTNWRYIAGTIPPTQYQMTPSGTHAWYNASAGTAGNVITYSQDMTLDNNGNLGLGAITPAASLHIKKSGDAFIVLENTGAGQTMRIDQNSIRTTTSSQINIFAGNQTNQLYLNGTTNRVGINTSSTAADGLTIGTASNGNCEFDLDNTSGKRWRWASLSNGQLQLIQKTDGYESMRVGATGFVGIGETNPDRWLHVNSGTPNVVAKFESTDPTAAIELTDSTSSVELQYTNGTFAVNHGGTGDISFQTTETDSVFISNQVHTASENSFDLTLYNASIANMGPRLRLRGGAQSTSVSRDSAWSDPDSNQFEMGSIWFDSTEGGSIYAAGMVGYAESDFNTGDNPSALAFYTTPDGTSTNVERMRIQSNGNVGIGAYPATEKLHIGSGQSNYIRIHNAGSGDVSSGISITRGDTLGLQIYDNPQDGTSTFNAEGNINFRTSGQSYRLYIKDNGNISIGTTTQTSRLNIAGPSSGSLPVFDIQTTGSGSFMRGVRMLGTQMATGNDLMYAVGSADSARNMGQMYFNYSGTSGSTDNSLRLGLHSVDHMLNLWGSGDIGIGKGTNSQDDPKPRAPFHVKKGGILFNGVGDDTQTTYDNNWTWFQCSGVSGTYSSAVRITIPDVNGSGQSLGFGSFSIEVYVSGYNGRYCHAYYSGYVNGGLSNGELATRAASSGTWTLSAGLEGTQGFYLNIAFPGSLTHPSVYVRVTKGGDTTNGRWTPLTSANINWT